MQIELLNIECESYMRGLPDKAFDLAIVDPPYGINAPKMRMGTNPNRRDGNGYPAVSTTQRLKGRLNSGGGTLKDRMLNTSLIDWDNAIPKPSYFKELFRVSKNQIIWGGELLQSASYAMHYLLG